MIKLFFVVLLFLYHLKTHHIFKAFQEDDIQYTSLFMRVWNEGATLLLFAIVFLVILKSSFHWIFGLLSLVGLAVLLMLASSFPISLSKSFLAFSIFKVCFASFISN